MKIVTLPCEVTGCAHKTQGNYPSYVRFVCHEHPKDTRDAIISRLLADGKVTSDKYDRSVAFASPEVQKAEISQIQGVPVARETEDIKPKAPEDKAEEKLLSGEASKRSDNIGKLRDEKSRIDVVFLSPSELKDGASRLEQARLGLIPPAPRPVEKSGAGIVADLRERVTAEKKRRCTIHNRPDCTECFPAAPPLGVVTGRLSHIEAERMHKKVRIIEAKEYGHTAIVEDAEFKEEMAKPGNEEKKIELLVKCKLERNKAKKPNTRVSKRKAKLKNVFRDKTKNLRLEFGYDSRQLASLLDDKEFNKPIPVLDYEFGYADRNMSRWYREIKAGEGKSVYRPHKASDDDKNCVADVQLIDGVAVTVNVAPMTAKDRVKAGLGVRVLVRPGTMPEWKSLLPTRQAPCLSDKEIAFYKDYAARNLSAEEMKTKHGEVSEDQIMGLENRIIKRAFFVRILNPSLGIRPASFERDLHEGWGLELRAIGAGVSYVGSVHNSGEYSADGRQRGLRNFKTGAGARGGPRAAESSGEGTVDAGMHDDYSEDSGS